MVKIFEKSVLLLFRKNYRNFVLSIFKTVFYANSYSKF